MICSARPKNDQNYKIFAYCGFYTSKTVSKSYFQYPRMISNFEFQLVCVWVPTLCVGHTCHCGKRVERDGLHGLSCTKNAGRRHATLNSLIKQTLGSLDLPSMLEPRGLYRTDGKRPDGVTMIPWEMGKQLVWDVTVVDALAPSRLNQGSLCNPVPPPPRLKRVKLRRIRN